MNGLNILEYFVGIVPHKVFFGSIPKQLIDNPHLLIDLDDVLSTYKLRYLNSDITIYDEFAVFIDLE